MTLREIAAIATAGGCEVQPEFLAKSTENDLVDAEFRYKVWLEGTFGSLASDEERAEYDAVEGYASARDQYAYEAGFRAGVRLMNDVMTNATPLADLEQRVHPRMEALKRTIRKRSFISGPIDGIPKYDLVKLSAMIAKEAQP